jgi:hypothetical protein
MKHRKARSPLAGSRNRELAAAMAEKGRSSAAGTHADRRTRRNRNRAAQRANAIKDAS